MPERRWELTDDASYSKTKDRIDAIILTALAQGPRSIYEIMAVLRAEGIGDAQHDGLLELSYSTTGTIFRSAKNSLRERGMIYDGWDAYAHSGVKKDFTQIYRRDLRARDLAPMQEEAASV
jgi:hypothetical protein